MQELIYTCILTGFNIIDPLAVDWFCTKISQRKKERELFRVITLIGIVGFMVAQPFLLELFAENMVVTYLINNSIIILEILYAALFYTISRKKAFIYMAVQFLAGTVVECILTMLLLIVFHLNMDRLGEADALKIISMFILEVTTVYVLFLLIKVEKKYSQAIVNAKIFFMILVSFVVDVIVLGVGYCKSSEQGNSKYFIGTVVAFIYEMLILLYSSYCIMKYKKKEEDYLQIIEFTHKQIEMLSQAQQGIAQSRRIIHDMTNHLCTLEAMAKKNMSKEIVQYVEKLIPEIKKGRGADVTNSILAVILYEKKAKAKQHSVDLECDIRIEDIKIPLHELNSIITNVLDNAIEATEKVKTRRERTVTFGVYVKDENLNIECENPYEEAPKVDKMGNFLTSKSDKSCHSKGIRIIYEYVEKNHGDVDIRYGNGMFHIRIILGYEIAVL